MAAITWLHLSDFHAGQRSAGAVWPAIDPCFEQDLRTMAARLGPPDLVLFTGDLAFGGAAEEYERVDELLERIRGWLGVDELPMFAVPGNHDLPRPKPDAFQSTLLYESLGDHYESSETARGMLWESKLAPGAARPHDALFADYMAWMQRRVVEPARARGRMIHSSPRMPGDFSAVFEQSGLRLGIVGLNSTWVQFRSGNYEGRLQLPSEQLQAALPNSDFFRGVDDALLLTHHPPSWLSKRAFTVYERDIHPPGRFALALFGHAHSANSQLVARDGAVARAYYQAHSLFGLEKYGTAEESRVFGYAWGCLRGDGELRVWPRRVVTQAGAYAFERDTDFRHVDDERGGVLLRAPRVPAGAVVVQVPRSAPGDTGGDEQLDRYRAAARAMHERKPMLGFHFEVRIQPKLDEVYVALDTVHELRLWPGDEDDFERPHGRTKLAAHELFSYAERQGARSVVLIGQPGSGKTTYLQRMLLAALDDPRALGLPADTVPVFLRLQGVSQLDLPAFIDAQLDDPTHQLMGIGEHLCKHGKLLLLFDGLDEVADAETRAEVAAWIETLHRNPHAYVVMSCRPAGYTDDIARRSFLKLELGELDDAKMAAFVHNWHVTVERHLQPDEPARAEAEAKRNADALLQVLAQREFVAVMRVYEMTRNPLLLSAICLVHYAQKRLPKERATLYEEAIRVLLERRRARRADEQPRTPEERLEPADVVTVLQPVAHWLHTRRERQASRLELLEPVATAIGRLRGRDLDAGRFLTMAREEAGLLTGFGVDVFGFMHLGFQEYLTASHLLDLGSGDARIYRELAGRFDDEWWREVILLLLARRMPNGFVPFMTALLDQPSFGAWCEGVLIDECFSEAALPSPEPFLGVLRRDADDRQLAVARLLDRVMPEQLVAVSDVLEGHGNGELRRWWQAKQGQADERTGIVFVRIPDGTFMMGSPDGEGEKREHPQHCVPLGPFELARTPVTNAQYRRYLEANPDVAPPEFWGDRSYNQPEQPVVGMSWWEAQAYCKWAGLVLPTEAQWEYACRAGTTTRYWSGDEERDLDEVGWYGGNSKHRLHPVGEKPANPFGLFDMHGNVWEWCRDAYGSYATSPQPVDGLRHEPVGAADRVLRGGSFFVDARLARAAYRSDWRPAGRSRGVGFRPARVVT